MLLYISVCSVIPVRCCPDRGLSHFVSRVLRSFNEPLVVPLEPLYDDHSLMVTHSPNGLTMAMGGMAERGVLYGVGPGNCCMTYPYCDACSPGSVPPSSSVGKVRGIGSEVHRSQQSLAALRVRCR